MIKEKLKKVALFRKAAKMLQMKSSRNEALMKNGYDVLRDVCGIFERNHINYFIDFGTLLGYVREGALLSFDIDIDFGVLYADKEKKKEIREIMKKSGYNISEYYEVDGDIKEESYKKGDNKFDIFYYQRGKDKNGNEYNYCHIFCRIDGKEYKSKNEASAGYYIYRMPIVPKEKSFNGIKVRVPENPEKLLEMKYGKNWRTPNKYWHYWYDAKVKDANKIAVWHGFEK